MRVRVIVVATAVAVMGTMAATAVVPAANAAEVEPTRVECTSTGSLRIYSDESRTTLVDAF
jgi:hypothetical protein